MIIEGEDHDPMEDEDHVPKNTFEDNGTNAFIHDTFGSGGGVADYDDDDDDYDEDDIEVAHDIPLFENAMMTLYE